MIVKPETVLRWHRQGFQLFWRRKSLRKTTPSRLPGDVVALIQRMVNENATWGAERIRGELLKLGIKVSKRTIQRHIHTVHPHGDGQRWSTFLKNHTAWACDFVQTYDCWFRPIFAFFIVDVNAKTVVHVGVTRSPSEAWTAQQLREVTPFGEGPDVIIRDRDCKFGAAFDRVAEGAGMRVAKAAVRTPNMNAVCERFNGSARRECLDHVLILGEQHLLNLLKEYAFEYFNQSRPHQGIWQRLPVNCQRKPYGTGSDVVGLPFLGGLHHDYRVAA
jgi:putative transposase